MSKAHKLFRMIFVLLLFSNIIQYAPELIARITILYTYVYVFLLLCRLSPTHQTLIIHLNCQNSTKAAGTLLSISNNGTTSQFRPPVPPNIPATRRRLTIELSNYQTIRMSSFRRPFIAEISVWSSSRAWHHAYVHTCICLYICTTLQTACRCSRLPALHSFAAFNYLLNILTK